MQYRPIRIYSTCLHPVQVPTAAGPVLCSCGSCPACRVQRASSNKLRIDVESTGCKYVDMVTLTYSDDFVPYVDFYDWENSYGFGDYPIHLGNRSVLRYQRSDFAVLPACDFNLHEDLVSSIDEYNSRYELYKRKYPNRNFSAPCHSKGCVRILVYSDLQKYLKRLRKLFKKRYNSTFRYFAIGEYGTLGLRPHFHILLFHNSDAFRFDMRNVIQLPGFTSENRREISKVLLPLWSFGDSVSAITDKQASKYLSSYVNSVGVLPSLLQRIAPPKTFHSIFLGEVRSQEILSSLFKSRKWSQLCEVSLLGSDGFIKDVSAPSAAYDRFTFRFTGSSSFSIKDTFTLFRSVLQIIHPKDFLVDVDGVIDADGDFDNYIAQITRSLVYRYSNHFHLDVAELNLCRLYYDYMKYSYRENNSFNPLKSLYYAASKASRLACYLGVDLFTYLGYVDSLRSYISLSRLGNLFNTLSSDINKVKDYYSSVQPNGLVMPSRDSIYYKGYVDDAIKEYNRSVKHQQAIESLKF